VDIAHRVFLTSLLAFFTANTQLSAAIIGSALYTISILWLEPFRRLADDRLMMLCQNKLLLLLIYGKHQGKHACLSWVAHFRFARYCERFVHVTRSCSSK
jgi:hypothetical protein